MCNFDGKIRSSRVKNNKQVERWISKKVSDPADPAVLKERMISRTADNPNQVSVAGKYKKRYKTAFYCLTNMGNFQPLFVVFYQEFVGIFLCPQVLVKMKFTNFILFTALGSAIWMAILVFLVLYRTK